MYLRDIVLQRKDVIGNILQKTKTLIISILFLFIHQMVNSVVFNRAESTLRKGENAICHDFLIHSKYYQKASPQSSLKILWQMNSELSATCINLLQKNCRLVQIESICRRQIKVP